MLKRSITESTETSGNAIKEKKKLNNYPIVYTIKLNLLNTVFRTFYNILSIYILVLSLTSNLSEREVRLSHRLTLIGGM